MIPGLPFYATVSHTAPRSYPKPRGDVKRAGKKRPPADRVGGRTGKRAAPRGMAGGGERIPAVAGRGGPSLAARGVRRLGGLGVRRLGRLGVRGLLVQLLGGLV